MFGGCVLDRVVGGVDGWSGEKEDAAGLVSLELGPDFERDARVCVVGQGVDFDRWGSAVGCRVLI